MKAFAKDKKRLFWVLLAIVGIVVIVLLTWASGRYTKSKCGEDKGSIYEPAVCVAPAK